MMNWFAEGQTKDELAPVIQGVQPASSISGSESLAWNAQQALNLVLTDRDLPREPTLPRATSYRSSLANELLSAIKGEKTVATALSDASKAWKAINKENGVTLQTKYEKSLGIAP